jgi:hypothetical protein
MRRVIAVIIASWLLVACGSQPGSACVSAKDVRQHVGKSGCFFGTAETQGPPVAGFSVVALREGPLDVFVDGAVSDELNGQCIEVSGQVNGYPDASRRLTLYVGPESNIRKCKQ